jgi:hypothetical protein
MKLKKIYGLTIILAILSSCSNPKKNGTNDKVVIEERITIPHTKSEKLFNQLRPESQKFQINASSDNIIISKNGTQVFVPKNSFINADGELVTGKVDIELIEVLSVADFIRTNLQTVSNGQPLQSEGMFYIDAKSGEQQITLSTDKKLQIELPKLIKTWSASEIRIFSGKYDTVGNINWIESGKIENSLITLPLDLFDYQTWISHNFERIPRNEGYTISNSFDLETDQVIDSTTFKQNYLKNTFIATREFEERFPYIINTEWVIGCYTSYYSTKVKRGRMIKDSTISKIYLANLDKDLWYCDSLAYSYIKTWEKKVDFHNTFYTKVDANNVIQLFKRFYEQRLTNVIRFPTDIDLSKINAREELIKKGLKEAEVDEIMGAYTRQKEIITARRNKETSQRISANCFAVAKLGWINCDQFYNEPTANEANILASVKNLVNYEFVTLTLVINGRRIALNGTLGDNFKYTFTGKSQPYTRLPIGEKATIIGISYKDNQPYLGIKEIIITEKGNYDINLQASSTQEIKTKLNAIE